MERMKGATRSRRQLDGRFSQIGPAKRFTPPVRGWIKAIREGLAMSSKQLADRLHIKQPSVTALEQSEYRGTIELATLRRAAEALNCTLVYALVPNKPLESIVRDRARALTRRRLGYVEHSMLLEDQKVNAKEFEERLEALVLDINPRHLWDENE